MDGLMTIELKGLHFYAYHGLYAEERNTGNEFQVDLAVCYQPGSGTITDISDTVNYAALYAMLKKEMANPRHLLETFVMEMAELIHLSFPRIKRIEISITKLHVPIPKFTGRAAVVYAVTY